MSTKKTTEAPEATTIDVSEFHIDQGRVSATVIGVTPLMCHNKSAQAGRNLLKPPRTPTKAERENRLKHNPLREYRDGCYLSEDPGSPTRLLFPARAFKGAMKTAAKHIPRIFMTEVAELITVEGEDVPLYGIPEMKMDYVVSSGRNAAPDIRTWPILPMWTLDLSIRYTRPRMSAETVLKLLEIGGTICGVGDGRPGRGVLDFGRYMVVPGDDERVATIRRLGSAKAQAEALESPGMYNKFTEDLYTWFEGELAGLDKSSRDKMLAA